MRTIPLTNSDKVALVDDADYAAVSQFSWRLVEKYPIRVIPLSEHCQVGKVIQQRLHIFLFGGRPNFEVDHKDRNELNCQRGNLRWATKSQNAANSKKRPGTSRYKGVSWSRARHRWVAFIKINYQNIYLGGFAEEVDAARAYDKAARQYFGDFANPNFLT